MGDISESSPLLSNTSPKTKKAIYFGFLVLGLSTLLPWNFFISANTYWDYKFRNVTSDNSSDSQETSLQKYFYPILVFASQAINFIFLFINALFSHLMHYRKRMLYSILSVTLLFSLTTLLAKIDTDSWQLLFFGITVMIIIFISASQAFFQGTLSGLAGMFPENIMSSMLSGQALGGVFTSIALIVSEASGADSVTSAFIYFLIADVIMVLALCTYFYVSDTVYFKSTVSGNDVNQGTTFQELINNQIIVFSQIWPMALSVCLIFMVTLSVFPATCVRIVSSSSNAVWRDVYFQPVATFLLFNLFDYIGRQAAGFVMWPKCGSKLLYVFSVARIVFIPLILMCNRTSGNIPVVFENDAYYIIIIILFALSNGYFSTLCMMYGPKLVKNEDAETAGSFMVTMLAFGLLMGSVVSLGFVKLS